MEPIVTTAEPARQDTPTGPPGRPIPARQARSLRTALARGAIEAWFQPEIELASGRVVGFEALARWRRPGGVLEAGDFVDEAVSLGLIDQISEVVCADAVVAARDWAGHGIVTWINVTATQVTRGHLPERLVRLCRETGVEPDALGVEITERSIIDDPDRAVSELGRLRDLGVRIALDDFGTGHSGLSRLRNLPADTVKIDRRFVAGLTHDRRDRVVVETIVTLARRLGLDLVAEGVEDPDTAAILAGMGCRCAQGWHWSPALPRIGAAGFAGLATSAPQRGEPAPLRPPRGRSTTGLE